MIGEKGRIELCPCLKYLDNLKTSENSRLIISVKSRSVRQRINKLFCKYCKRIELINKHFGEDNFIDNLKNKLRYQIN